MARDRASRPEARPLRLFVAVDIPAAVRDGLEDAVETLRERVGNARWVPPQNWHVTMKFLGSTWPRLLDRVREACAGVASSHRPVETRLTGLGAFPSERRARVLWAGLDDPEERLSAIANALDRALAPDFKTEKRAFTAHLTVARLQPARPVGEAMVGLDPRSKSFPIEGLVLYQSHLQRPAPRYEPVEEFPLSGR